MIACSWEEASVIWARSSAITFCSVTLLSGNSVLRWAVRAPIDEITGLELSPGREEERIATPCPQEPCPDGF